MTIQPKSSPLPEGMEPEGARAALTAVIRRTMEAPGTFDRRGWLTVGFCGHQPSLGEPYISTGSLYLCSTVLLPLGLPTADPFWSGPPQSWTFQKIWRGMTSPQITRFERSTKLETMRKLIAVGAVFAATATAQSLSLGVRASVPFTDVVNATTANNTSFLPQSTNFIIGPALQINLPLSLRFEVDALYRPYSFSASNLADTISAAQWQFPFLAQYRFNAPVVRPFIEAGLSFDHLSNISSAARNISSGPGKLVQQSHAGVVLGAGVDVKLLLVRVSGELRYTRQGSADFEAISKLNQAGFLLGVHF